jgi:hypothetical protein
LLLTIDFQAKALRHWLRRGWGDVFSYFQSLVCRINHY